MLVRDLQIGNLYKIRSDRETYVCMHKNFLDIHVGKGFSPRYYTIKINSLLIYLGKDLTGNRTVIYKGRRCWVYPNAWQHIIDVKDKNL